MALRLVIVLLLQKLEVRLRLYLFYPYCVSICHCKFRPVPWSFTYLRMSAPATIPTVFFEYINSKACLHLVWKPHMPLQPWWCQGKGFQITKASTGCVLKRHNWQHENQARPWSLQLVWQESSVPALCSPTGEAGSPQMCGKPWVVTPHQGPSYQLF